MDEITTENIQNFCHACLSWVGKSEEDQDNPIAKENLDFYPHLRKFMNLMVNDQKTTMYNSTQEYPKLLCKICFKQIEKIEADYQKFRDLIIISTQRIQAIIKSKEKHDIGSDQSDDDNKLLLPELADWNMSDIKAEPPEALEILRKDYELYNDYERADIEKHVKTEIDYVFDDGGSSCDPYVMNESYTNLDEQLQETCNDELKKRDRNKKSFKCPRCNKHAYKKVYLDAHIRKIHEGLEKPFLCSVSDCQKAFTRYNQLHVHVQTNHTKDAIKFTCDIEGCNESFRLGQTLDTHRKVAHKFKNKTPLDFKPINKEHIKHEWMIRENICQECGKRFHSKKALSEHLRRHANDKRYVCEVCNVSKVTKTELITHKRVHDRSLEKFKCSLCPQEFNHKNAISRHIRVVHEGERRFSCRFCPRRFGTKNSQICHERLHTGEKPFKCEICSKGFTQIEGLKSHMKNHDKNLRKHICKFCSSRFITRKNLLDHEQRHLGNKPHICRFCSRGFPRSEDLKLHSKDHHADAFTDEDPKNEYILESSEETERTKIQEQTDLLKDYFKSGGNDPLTNYI